jgi:hypothetical protein
MTPQEQRLEDLGKLTMERIERAVTSVTQLLDDEREVYSLMLGVIASLIAGSAGVVADGMEQQNGKRPSEGEARLHVVLHLMERLGFQTEVQNELKRRTGAAKKQ